ncbi:hypothetical protein DXU03_37715 [Rhizobium johnstonii]
MPARMRITFWRNDFLHCRGRRRDRIGFRDESGRFLCELVVVVQRPIDLIRLMAVTLSAFRRKFEGSKKPGIQSILHGQAWFSGK